MSSEPDITTPPQPLPAGQLLFSLTLLLIGLFFIGLTAYRYLRSPIPLVPFEETNPERDLAAEAKQYLRQTKPAPLSESMQQLLADPKSFHVPTQPHSLLGKPAPDFTLEDSAGRPWRLADALAKGPGVVVFYYGYYCNHCVSQLFDLNEDIARFRELGAAVVAVSADTPELTRERFRQYGAFAYPVLSDPGNALARRYGVFTPAREGKPQQLDHGTFVVGRDGRVKWAISGDEPFSGNRTLLYELARSEGKLP